MNPDRKRFRYPGVDTAIVDHPFNVNGLSRFFTADSYRKTIHTAKESWLVGCV